MDELTSVIEDMRLGEEATRSVDEHRNVESDTVLYRPRPASVELSLESFTMMRYHGE